MASADLTWKEVDRLAASLEPELRETFFQYLEGVRGLAPDEQTLARAINAGDVDQVVTLLGLAEDPPSIGLRDAIAAQLPEISRELLRLAEMPDTAATFAFDRANPRVLTWLDETEFRLIRQINAGTREGVRQVVRAGIQAGDNPLTTARQVRQLVGLTSRQSQAVMNFERLLRQAAAGDSGAAAAARSRKLRDRRFSVREGLSEDKIRRQVERYRERYINYRAQNIARTESINALNQANQETWRQMAEEGRVDASAVRRFWVVARDELTCPRCRPIPALNPTGVKLEQAFQTPADGLLMAPVVHPSCRCAVFIRTVEGEIEGPDVEFSRNAPEAGQLRRINDRAREERRR